MILIIVNIILFGHTVNVQNGYQYISLLFFGRWKETGRSVSGNREKQTNAESDSSQNREQSELQSKFTEKWPTGWISIIIALTWYRGLGMYRLNRTHRLDVRNIKIYGNFNFAKVRSNTSKHLLLQNVSNWSILDDRIDKPTCIHIRRLLLSSYAKTASKAIVIWSRVPEANLTLRKL